MTKVKIHYRLPGGEVKSAELDSDQPPRVVVVAAVELVPDHAVLTDVDIDDGE